MRARWKSFRSKIGPIRSTRTRLGVLGLVGVLMAVGAGAAWAAIVDPSHIPGANNDGKSCEEVYPGAGLTELKGADGANGAPGTYLVSSGGLSVTFKIPSTVNDPDTGNPNPNSLDFTAGSGTVVVGVIVKDGVDEANFYDYSPDGVTSDTYLTTPNDGAKGISHAIACVKESNFQPLTAEKTAQGSYDRTVTWDLTKSVDPKSHTGNAGENAGTSTWTVVADKTEKKDNYKVTGNITISNSNNVAVNVDVSDALDDNTVADVDCDPGTAGNQASGTVPAADASATASWSAATTPRRMTAPRP